MGQDLIIAIVWPKSREGQVDKLREDLTRVFDLCAAPDYCDPETAPCSFCRSVIRKVGEAEEFYELKSYNARMPHRRVIYEIYPGWRYWGDSVGGGAGLYTIAILRYLKEYWSDLVFYGGDYGSELELVTDKALEDLWQQWCGWP